MTQNMSVREQYERITKENSPPAGGTSSLSIVRCTLLLGNLAPILPLKNGPYVQPVPLVLCTAE